MTNTVAEKVLNAAPAMTVGQYAVVVLAATCESWSTGVYRTSPAAFGVATRNQNDHTNAYVVKCHRAGITAYLAPDVILGSRLNA